VRDPCELGSLVAAHKAGIPQLQVAISMDQFIEAVGDWLDEPLRELEAMAGLESMSGAQLIFATPTLTCVPPTLDARTDAAPKSVRDRGRVWRFRSDQRPTGPALPGSWGDPDAPLVYVSFGSVAGSTGRFSDLYPAVLEALAEQHVRVLMTTGLGGDPASLHAVPANAWVTPWWPQEAAMREAAAVVGHGGFGTTMTAVAAGMPQIVMPLFALDQFFNAERIHAVGAGLHLPDGLAAVDALPTALASLLDQPDFAHMARTIAAEMAALPDVALSVEVLEGLVRTSG